MTHAVSTRSNDEEAQWQHAGAVVKRQLRDLFDRVPSLAGFRLRLMRGRAFVRTHH
jgi:hypothetical protein